MIISASLLLVILVSIGFMIRPSEKVAFESLEEGKESVDIKTNPRLGSVTAIIPEKRINQELAEQAPQNAQSGIKLIGMRLDLKENLIIYKSNLVLYKNPIGFEMSLVPEVKNDRVYLKATSAKLGSLKIPPDLIMERMAKSLPEDNIVKYDESLKELYIELKMDSNNVYVKDLKVGEDEVQVEMKLKL